MQTPGAGASAANGARREWLERLQTATTGALDDACRSADPALQMLASDLEQLAICLERELDAADHGESSAPGIG